MARCHSLLSFMYILLFESNQWDSYIGYCFAYISIICYTQKSS